MSDQTGRVPPGVGEAPSGRPQQITGY